MTTYNDRALAAIAHIRRFLNANAHETLTGHHDAYDRLKAVSHGLEPETRAAVRELDVLLVRVLNMAHEYAEKKEAE